MGFIFFITLIFILLISYNVGKMISNNIQIEK